MPKRLRNGAESMPLFVVAPINVKGLMGKLIDFAPHLDQ